MLRQGSTEFTGAYKPSFYNLRAVDVDGSAFLLNTATAARLYLSPEQQARLQTWQDNSALFEAALHQSLALPSPISSPLESASPIVPGCPQDVVKDPTDLRVSDDTFALHLLQHGFFVPSERQEVQEVLERMRLERQQSSHISLTLSMTSDCDLACPYCVINTTQGRGGMPLHVQQALLRWWEKQLVGRETCSFEWMGGEPLLYPETLISLGKQLLERAAFAGVRCVHQTLITNGTNLTPALAPRLKDLGINHVQVTLDGPPESHDQCRPAADGSGSFERILENLKQVSGFFNISIRVNLSAQNASLANTLLDRLVAEGLEKHVQVYPARVYEPEAKKTGPVQDEVLEGDFGDDGDGLTGESAQSSACGATPGIYSHCSPAPQSLTPEVFGKISTVFELDALERGFGRTGLPGVARGGFCGAYHQSYFVVGPDGLLYRCPSRVGQVKSSAIGSVFDLTPAPWMGENQKFYDGLAPTQEKGCFSCKILPTCLGGCPEESKVSGRLRDECSPWRFRIKNQLVIEHEWFHAHYKELTV